MYQKYVELVKTTLKENNEQSGIHVFCDMDGVLTDWEAHFTAKTGKDFFSYKSRGIPFLIAKRWGPEWWATMPWLEGGKDLWNYLHSNVPEGNLHILSSPATGNKPNKATGLSPEQSSTQGKLEWLKNQGITAQIGESNIHITQNKHQFVIPETTSILVDDSNDRTKINKWVKAGGIYIVHTSANESIAELNKHLPV